jgi:hypothetical protein
MTPSSRRRLKLYLAVFLTVASVVAITIAGLLAVHRCELNPGFTALVTILIIFSAACTCGYAAHVFLDLMACINDTESKGDGA